jgi:hypothetical protein
MTNTPCQPLLKAQFIPPTLNRATVAEKLMQPTPSVRIMFVQPSKSHK